MKAKKLAEFLLKHPNLDVIISERSGDYTELKEAKDDIRIGALILQLGQRVHDDPENDERLRWAFDSAEALKEAKALLKDLNSEELQEFLKDYKVKSKEEFLKLISSDEKKLKKLAYDYFYMK